MTKSATASSKTNGSSIATGCPPWHAPELDSPAQRAKWERTAAKPWGDPPEVLGGASTAGQQDVRPLGRVESEVSKKSSALACVRAIRIEQQYKGEPIAEPVTMQSRLFFRDPRGHYGTAKGREQIEGSQSTCASHQNPGCRQACLVG